MNSYNEFDALLAQNALDVMLSRGVFDAVAVLRLLADHGVDIHNDREREAFTLIDLIVRGECATEDSFFEQLKNLATKYPNQQPSTVTEPKRKEETAVTEQTTAETTVAEQPAETETEQPAETKAEGTADVVTAPPTSHVIIAPLTEAEEHQLTLTGTVFPSELITISDILNTRFNGATVAHYICTSLSNTQPRIVTYLRAIADLGAVDHDCYSIVLYNQILFVLNVLNNMFDNVESMVEWI